jgi:hypothetical protein
LLCVHLLSLFRFDPLRRIAASDEHMENLFPLSRLT